MQYIQGKNREQIEMFSYESFIAADNPVRVIDAFVDALNLKQLDFLRDAEEQKNNKAATSGRPAFHPSTLLRIYFYGYLNRIRSSRRLEKECEHNIELRWLTGALTPNYHTIADFRKDDPKQLCRVFKAFVQFMHGSDLLEGENIAIDGTKVRAVNSKKNNYNQDKIDRQLKYIENKTTEYLKQLDQGDEQESKHQDVVMKKEKVAEQLAKLKERKEFYKDLSKQLTESNDEQISTTDKDSRALLIHHNQIEVGYNIQTATDDKNNLIIHYDATNEKDTKALYSVAHGAKEALNKKPEEFITALADKGFHNGEQLQQCEQNNIETIVAYRDHCGGTGVPAADYYVEKFIYDGQTDTYSCPQLQTLTTNGNWYKKDHTGKTRKNSSTYLVKHYKTTACTACVVKHLCTSNVRGRLIERSQYQSAVDNNNLRVKTQKERYKKRQAIVEHPFGTIKRAWGYYHTLLKGKEKVSGEYGLIFTVYNLRRTMSILGIKPLIEKLKAAKWSLLIKNIFEALYRALHPEKKFPTTAPHNSLYEIIKAMMSIFSQPDEEGIKEVKKKKGLEASRNTAGFLNATLFVRSSTLCLPLKALLFFISFNLNVMRSCYCSFKVQLFEVRTKVC